MIGMDGERESENSILLACIDDNDDDDNTRRNENSLRNIRNHGLQKDNHLKRS